MCPSMTRSATATIAVEDYTSHLVDAIRTEAVSSSWNDSLTNELVVRDQTTHEDMYLQAHSVISVYHRNVQYDYLDIGGSQSDVEVNMTIEVNTQSRSDFVYLNRVLESYILANYATHTTMTRGRTELRLRLKLNNSNNLSDERSKMYRHVYDVSMRVTYSL